MQKKSLKKLFAILTICLLLFTTIIPGGTPVFANVEVSQTAHEKTDNKSENEEQGNDQQDSSARNNKDVANDSEESMADTKEKGTGDEEKNERDTKGFENTEGNNSDQQPVFGDPSIQIDADAIVVEVEVQSELPIHSVTLHAKQSDAIGFEEIPMQLIEGNRYTVTIPLSRIWSERIEYYFVANTGAGVVVSDRYTYEIPHEPVDYQKLPNLLITEITPDTVNRNGADAFEFIEVYNNTTEPINIKDYRIIYRYPTNTPDQIWDLNEDKKIGPGESFIVWIHNDGNKDLTVEDFNNHYGLNMPESHVTIIESGGMANGSERTIILQDDFGNEIVRGTYNDGGRDVYPDRGIVYKYPVEGTVMKKVGIGETVTPLTVFPEQVPPELVKIDPDAELPEIGDIHIEEKDEGFIFTVSITSNVELIGGYLYIQQSDVLGYQSYPLEENPDEPGIFSVTIPLTELWADSITYYVVARNQAGSVETEPKEYRLIKEDIDFQTLPPLLITELVPDSTNRNGLDAYEFIEVYNNTDQDIDFSDYTIRYRYPAEGPAGDLFWGPPEGEKVIIPAREAVVFWIINAGNQDLTADDFNRHYGTDLVEGNNLIKIYNNGMANSAMRTIVIATKTGFEIARATYFDEVGRDDTIPDKGILYKYPVDGSIEMKKISAGDVDATPGSVLPEQVPQHPVQLADDHEKPVIEDLTDLDVVTSTEDITLTAKITDNIQVKRVTLFYTIYGGAFAKVDLVHDWTDDTIYNHTIYRPELIGKETLEYYFVASDGTNETRTAVKTLQIEHPYKREGFRLNIEDGDLFSGDAIIKATADEYTDEIRLFVDGEEVTETFKALETEAYFAFDVRKVNLYFKNGVTMGDEILMIFDDQIDTYTTLTVPIPPEKLKIGDNTITIRSGTKASPFDEDSPENRDDFYIKNIRLILGDGTTIYDPEYADPAVEYSIGDSAGMKSVYDFTFTIPAETFMSTAIKLDTKQLADGEHEISAVFHNERVQATIITDNTPPEIVPTVAEGKEYKGSFVIDAKVTDRTSSVTEVSATLDGKDIELPYETSSAALDAGEHVIVFTAIDAAGNVAKETVTFSVVHEHPDLPDEEEVVAGATDAKLSVRVQDPTGDVLDVAFYKGYQYTVANQDHLSVSYNAVSTEPPLEFRPEGEAVLDEEELQKLIAIDGESFINESVSAFPYQRFDITVDEEVKPTDEIEIVWHGSSLPGRKITMYAWNFTTEEWDPLISTIAGEKQLHLKGTVTGIDYVQDHKVSVIVQDQVASVESDFTFIWMSDTQYYSESYPYIYESMVDWIIASEDELRIEYVIHTGDLVDDWDDFAQWAVADTQMRKLDEANIPYGVLAGNHDVNHKSLNYENYYHYFGKHRFHDRPYYGGSYKNNRGHYDLISVDGVDFIIVYLGWGVEEDEEGIQWMNEVLKAHSNRIAILCFHEYLLASGNRSPVGDKLFEEVVIPNENVLMVLSGHYHNAETLIDEIDDDGDGIPDRTVYQMLADYQGGPEGGQGFMRILNFSIAANQVHVQTYSPYLDQYNYYDPIEFPGKDEFTLSLDLTPKRKMVATDYVEVNVYTEQLIGVDQGVPSGEVASVIWEGLEPEQKYFWYVVVTDEFGGKTRSPIWSFTTELMPEPGDPDDPDDPFDPGDPEEPGEPDDPDAPDKQDDQSGPGDESGDSSEDNGSADHEQKGDDKQNVADRPDRKQDPTGDGKGTERKKQSLPETATHWFNLFMIGVVLSMTGTVAFYYYRNRHLIRS